jgi:hypothetical protein
MRFPCFVLITIALAAGGLPSVAAQQTREQVDSAFATSCRRAAEAMTTPRTAPGWARGNIVQCTESGPGAIAAVWTLVTADDDTLLSELRHWSQRLRDERIFDAALATAADVSRDQVVRFVALQVLLSYVDPHLVVTLGDLEGGDGVPLDLDDARRGTGGPPISSAVDVTVRTGSMPPGAEAAERVVSALRELTVGDRDRMSWAARGLWQQLIDLLPQLGLADAEALTLTAVCGTQYRITNPLPVSFSVEVVWSLGSSRIRIPRGDSVTVDRGGATEGLTLRYAGRDIATVRPSTEACP